MSNSYWAILILKTTELPVIIAELHVRNTFFIFSSKSWQTTVLCQFLTKKGLANNSTWPVLNFFLLHILWTVGYKFLNCLVLVTKLKKKLQDRVSIFFLLNQEWNSQRVQVKWYRRRKIDGKKNELNTVDVP